MRFYIVEDDMLIREGLRDCFAWQSVGARVVGSAENGDTAFREILRLGVDVVLTDIVMPGMNGTELAFALREAGWRGEILMMSAYQDVQYVRAALKSQAVDFLFKPIQTSELEAGIKSAIERSLAGGAGARYAGRAWRDKVSDAARALNAQGLREALLEACAAMRADDPDAARFRARAADMLAYAAGEVRLQRVERALLKEARALSGDAEPGAALRRYEAAVNAAIEALHNAPRDWQFAQNVFCLIEANVKRVDAEGLARELHISRASFYRLFSRCFEESLNDYAQKIRMRAAMALLKDTNMMIYEVAERAGYADVNYFSRLFKQYAGVLPSEYRTASANAPSKEDETHE